MQVIPTTGIAQGLKFLETSKSSLFQKGPAGENPVVICSLGDASITEGEVSEAFQFAVLKKLPIIYLVQDNRWGISVSAEEARVMDALTYANGFPGMEKRKVDGADFEESFMAMKEAVDYVRLNGGPLIVQADVPLLGHHTSGVRKEFYRSADDLAQHALKDPRPMLRNRLLRSGITEIEIAAIEAQAKNEIEC